VIRPKTKLNRKRKRSGRNSTWHEEVTNDWVDVACEVEYLRKKIIFTNNKNTEAYNNVFHSIVTKESLCASSVLGNRLKTSEFHITWTITAQTSITMTQLLLPHHQSFLQLWNSNHLSIICKGRWQAWTQESVVSHWDILLSVVVLFGPESKFKCPSKREVFA